MSWDIAIGTNIMDIIIEDAEMEEFYNVPDRTVTRDDVQNDIRRTALNRPMWIDDDYVSIRSSSSCDRSSLLMSPERAVTPLPELVIENESKKICLGNPKGQEVEDYMIYVIMKGITELNKQSNISQNEYGEEISLVKEDYMPQYLKCERIGEIMSYAQLQRDVYLREFQETITAAPESYDIEIFNDISTTSNPNPEYIKEVMSYVVSQGDLFLNTFQDVEEEVYAEEGQNLHTGAEHSERSSLVPERLSCIIDQVVRKSDQDEKNGEHSESFKRIWNDTPEENFVINTERRLSETLFKVPQLVDSDIEGLMTEVRLSDAELQPANSEQLNVPTINVEIDVNETTKEEVAVISSRLNVPRNSSSAETFTRINDAFVTTRSKYLPEASADEESEYIVTSGEKSRKRIASDRMPEHSSKTFRILRLCSCKHHTCVPYKPNKKRRH